MIQHKDTVLRMFFVFTLVGVLFYSCEPECKDVTDIDGNIYKTIRIGDQCWMAENLKVTKYRNGDTIPMITNNSIWIGLGTGAYCNYNNNTFNSNTYGRLYNWYAVSDSRNIAPDGWHIPTDAEWITLENYLGGYLVAGGKMKVASGNVPPWNGTNTSGFAALPAGMRFQGNGIFYDMDTSTGYWSTTGYNAATARCMVLILDEPWSILTNYSKTSGISIRCIKD